MSFFSETVPQRLVFLRCGPFNTVVVYRSLVLCSGPNFKIVVIADYVVITNGTDLTQIYIVCFYPICKVYGLNG